MAKWKGVYTLTEDIKILRYIIDGNHGRSTKGDGIWRKMEEEDIVPGRTWQGLKNRWRKHICVDLGRPEYGLTHEEKTELKSEISLNGRSQGGEYMKIKKQKESDHESEKDDVPELPEPASKKDKDFFSLDMNWSDDDTE